MHVGKQYSFNLTFRKFCRVIIGHNFKWEHSDIFKRSEREGARSAPPSLPPEMKPSSLNSLLKFAYLTGQ